MHSDSRHRPHSGAHHADQFDDASFEPPSKSSLKREMHALQDLGEQLVALSPERLKKMPLPDGLYDAIRDAQRFKMEARRRQMQYIGKLMRKIDAEPIRTAITARRERQRIETMRFRRLEQWRDRIAREGRPAVEQFATDHPDRVDPATLEELLGLAERATREHRERLPLQASRELFRRLREIAQPAANDQQ